MQEKTSCCPNGGARGYGRKHDSDHGESASAIPDPGLSRPTLPTALLNAALRSRRLCGSAKSVGASPIPTPTRPYHHKKLIDLLIYAYSNVSKNKTVAFDNIILV